MSVGRITDGNELCSGRPGRADGQAAQSNHHGTGHDNRASPPPDPWCSVRGSCRDEGPNGLIVVDLATGDARRRLHDHPSTKAAEPGEFLPIVEGVPFLERSPDGPPQPVRIGSDGIAIAADGVRIYYCPLASRRLYSVDAHALWDPASSEDDVAATVVDEGDKGTGADGLETDDQGRIYITSYEHDAVLRRHPDGTYEGLVHHPRLLWPDTLSVAADRHLYVTANQLHRQAPYQGQDERRPPYALFRTPIDAGPVRLR